MDGCRQAKSSLVGAGIAEVAAVHDVHEAANGRKDKTMLVLGPFGQGSPSIFPVGL